MYQETPESDFDGVDAVDGFDGVGHFPRERVTKRQDTGPTPSSPAYVGQIHDL